jgi:hypothetical protein
MNEFLSSVEAGILKTVVYLQPLIGSRAYLRSLPSSLHFFFLFISPLRTVTFSHTQPRPCDRYGPEMRFSVAKVKFYVSLGILHGYLLSVLTVLFYAL